MVAADGGIRFWAISRPWIRRRLERGNERNAGDSAWPGADFLQHRRRSWPPILGDSNVLRHAGDRQMAGAAGGANGGDGQDCADRLGIDLDRRDLFFDSGDEVKSPVCHFACKFHTVNIAATGGLGDNMNSVNFRSSILVVFFGLIATATVAAQAPQP